MNINISIENYIFFSALASRTRLKLISILLKNCRNYGELAEELNISTVMISKHIEILKKAGIIEVFESNGKKGKQKVCRLVIKNYQLLHNATVDSEIEHFEIPIGHYTHCTIPKSKTCGLATKNELIGRCDDNRYFSHPNRYDAKIIWFEEGDISYTIPGVFFTLHSFQSIEFSMELCSEAPGIKENYPSDIVFIFNGVEIGIWTSPGDFGVKKGIFTPKWWFLTEYGNLVKIKIDSSGTYINDELISNKTILDYYINSESDNIFTISSPSNVVNPGGLNLFGRDFGNYNQDIAVIIKHNKNI